VWRGRSRLAGCMHDACSHGAGLYHREGRETSQPVLATFGPSCIHALSVGLIHIACWQRLQTLLLTSAHISAQHTMHLSYSCHGLHQHVASGCFSLG
jgi:hypothetical protein